MLPPTQVDTPIYVPLIRLTVMSNIVHIYSEYVSKLFLCLYNIDVDVAFSVMQF